MRVGKCACEREREYVYTTEPMCERGRVFVKKDSVSGGKCLRAIVRGQEGGS